MKELLFQKVEMTIRDLSIHGDGIGQYEGFTLFVPGALPHEKVLVKIKKVKKSYGLAKLISILETSPQRVTANCPYFGRCGGCQIMHLSYEGQCDIKKSRIIESFSRLGKLQVPKDFTVIPSPSDIHYRNKIQLPFCLDQDRLSVGLFAKGTHDIVPVKRCLIHNSLAESILDKVVSILDKHQLKPYRAVDHKLAILRHLLLRTAIRNNEILITLITHSKPLEVLKNCAQEIMKVHPSIKGVMHHENTRTDNVILDQKFTLLSGRSYIEEMLHGIKYKISAPSFFQVNPSQAENLYQKALEYGQLNSNSTAVDAYCGIGTFSLFLAKAVKEVVGIECVEKAILDAKDNARNNAISNVDFRLGDAKKILLEISKADVVYLNPPRKGCDSAVLEKILELGPKTIVYTSCDPTTLARDAAILCESQYRLNKLTGFDMFPQTMHVETLAQFTKTPA